MYQADYHLHSGNSDDAHYSMREMVFTDHIEINEGGFSFQKSKLDPAREEFLETKKEFEGKIVLKWGVEIAQGTWAPEEYQKVVSSYPFDFVLCSVHRAFKKEDYAVMSYDGKDPDALMAEYLREVYKAALTLDYDCFGHIDYVTRYFYVNKIMPDIRKYYSAFEKIFRTIIKRGKGIELNLSGLLRENHNKTMPQPEILKIYRDLGGEIITLGSDSHVPEKLGKANEAGIELLKRMGFDKICIYNGRVRSYRKIV